jgi:hypothetical protein
MSGSHVCDHNGCEELPAFSSAGALKHHNKTTHQMKRKINFPDSADGQKQYMEFFRRAPTDPHFPSEFVCPCARLVNATQPCFHTKDAADVKRQSAACSLVQSQMGVATAGGDHNAALWLAVCENKYTMDSRAQGIQNMVRQTFPAKLLWIGQEGPTEEWLALPALQPNKPLNRALLDCYTRESGVVYNTTSFLMVIGPSGSLSNEAGDFQACFSRVAKETAQQYLGVLGSFISYTESMAPPPDGNTILKHYEDFQGSPTARAQSVFKQIWTRLLRRAIVDNSSNNKYPEDSCVYEVEQFLKRWMRSPKADAFLGYKPLADLTKSVAALQWTWKFMSIYAFMKDFWDLPNEEPRASIHRVSDFTQRLVQVDKKFTSMNQLTLIKMIASAAKDVINGSNPKVCIKNQHTTQKQIDMFVNSAEHFGLADSHSDVHRRVGSLNKNLEFLLKGPVPDTLSVYDTLTAGVPAVFPDHQALKVDLLQTFRVRAPSLFPEVTEAEAIHLLQTQQEEKNVDNDDDANDGSDSEADDVAASSSVVTTATKQAIERYCCKFDEALSDVLMIYVQCNIAGRMSEVGTVFVLGANRSVFWRNNELVVITYYNKTDNLNKRGVATARFIPEHSAKLVALLFWVVLPVVNTLRTRLGLPTSLSFSQIGGIDANSDQLCRMFKNQIPKHIDFRLWRQFQAAVINITGLNTRTDALTSVAHQLQGHTAQTAITNYSSSSADFSNDKGDSKLTMAALDCYHRAFQQLTALLIAASDEYKSHQGLLEDQDVNVGLPIGDVEAPVVATQPAGSESGLRVSNTYHNYNINLSDSKQYPQMFTLSSMTDTTSTQSGLLVDACLAELKFSRFTCPTQREACAYALEIRVISRVGNHVAKCYIDVAKCYIKKNM